MWLKGFISQMLKRTRVAKTVLLVGHGYWGKKILATLRAFSDWQVLVFDKAENELSLDEFLAKSPNFSHIIIATPEKTHYQLAKKFLLLNKNVLVEKPLCLLEEEAKELINLAKAKKLFLLVDYIFLYDQFLFEVKKTLQAKTIGKIEKVEIFRSSPGFTKPDLLVSDDLMVHDLYLLRYLFANIKNDLSELKILNQLDQQQLKLEFKLENNILVEAFYSWLESKAGRKLTFLGENGSLIWAKDSLTEQLIISKNKQEEIIFSGSNDNNPLFKLLEKFLKEQEIKSFEASYNDYLADVINLSQVRNAFYAIN